MCFYVGGCNFLEGTTGKILHKMLEYITITQGGTENNEAPELNQIRKIKLTRARVIENSADALEGSHPYKMTNL